MLTNKLKIKKEDLTITAIYNKIGIVLLLAILIIVCTMLSPVFLTSINILNLLTQVSVITIIACGITMLIITGNTDLSAGSMVALTGCIAMGMYKLFVQDNGINVVLGMFGAVGSAIIVSIVMYLIASLIITRYRAPAFIVTLAISTAARGLALLYTDARPITAIGEIGLLGQHRLWGFVPVPVIFMIVIVLISGVFLTQTRLGKYLYAIGGNHEAAKAAGIKTKTSIIKAYLIHAVFVGIAGVLFMARINSGQPSEAVGLEFDAITAAIIGGASLAGGIGTIRGTLVGAIIIGIIRNILTLLHVQAFYQLIVTGIIIVLAVVIDIKTKSGKHA